MSDENIALSFDTAEYYNLQEACDYLNRKNKTDNLTPKKLLKLLFSKRINTFIHFRMDNLKRSKMRFDVDSYDSNLYDNSIYNLDRKELKPALEKIRKIEDYLSRSIIDALYMGQILFRVYDITLLNIILNPNLIKATPCFIFDGFIYYNDLNDDPSKPSKLNEWRAIIDEKEYFFKEIGAISIVIESIDDNDLAEFNDKVPFKCSFDKRDTFSFAEIHITIEDLIILHKDLQIFERKLLSIESKEEDYKLKPTKGKSVEKILAQELAKHIAAEQWEKDTDKTIKIGEMCQIVWSKLVDIHLVKQLPNNITSLKPWIKDVAPDYAREGGRPESN